MKLIRKFASVVLLVASFTGASAIFAQELLAPEALSRPTFRNWMNPDVGQAWQGGLTGRGTTITFVDDFRSSTRYYGDLGTGRRLLRHGQWTAMEGRMVAPGASRARHDYNSGKTVRLRRGLDVMNLSYGSYAPSYYDLAQIRWSAQEGSLISYADGDAIIVKAAGNDGIRLDGIDSDGRRDFLNLALVGEPTAIFVGALTRNGSVGAPASMASYSNTPGSDTTIQSQFLVVGVDSSQTGLAGTSFAAPVVSGYAAILGQKFRGASPTEITNQLLNTARQDTLSNFNAATHGMGEASLSRALAPLSIR
jgi:hypothetical protein